MRLSNLALEAPTYSSIDAWLRTPRLAKCGEYFTPSEPMWWPDRSVRSAINWQTAILCVSPELETWLHAALAIRMAEVAQGTMGMIASILSRAAQEGLDPLDEDHLIDFRERFNMGEFSALSSFMEFWQACESLKHRPSRFLIESYKSLPRKKRDRNDVILRLDPEQGPFTQAEQDALYQWAHNEFCHGVLDPERYLYLRLAMIYGQRGVQLRMLVFGDFIKTEQGYLIRIFWAKQKGEDAAWRAKAEYFNLDEDFYNTVQAYKSLTLAQLEKEYPGRADWNSAIEHVPLFRRKYDHISRGEKQLPILIDLPGQDALEDGPVAKFHATGGAIRSWLLQMEGGREN